jgi:dTDP-4-amino-4,6-dideoxygalactose transaminase
VEALAVKFNIPTATEDELFYLKDALKNQKISGDGPYTQKCDTWIEKNLKTSKALLTTSCTHALEMAAILCNLKKDDEIIIPSFTFVSTANAFVVRGAKIVFIDIRPDTMNIDEKLIEEAITGKTRVIVPVHYAGVSCEMDVIMNIAQKYNLYVVEDSAQGVMAFYNEKALGTIGDFGCYSFHETKNYSMGEGGAILINDQDKTETAEIIREKGTNRAKFFRGEIDKYTWVDYGSSYLPSDINAAYLYPQLLQSKAITDDRLGSWNRYYNSLKHLSDKGCLELPFVPDNCTHNAHIFYIKLEDLDTRTKLIRYLNSYDISAVFHYVPLHNSPAGKLFGTFFGTDKYTTKESDRLLRLPMYYKLKPGDIDLVISKIEDFFKSSK